MIENTEATGHARDGLDELNAKFRSLLDTMTAGVIILDAEGVVSEASSRACEILGVELVELCGLRSMDPRWRAVHEDGSEFAGPTHPGEVALRTGKEIRGSVMGVFNPVQAELRWICINASPRFREGESLPCGACVVFEDITMRKRAEENLSRQTRVTDSFMTIPKGALRIGTGCWSRFWTSAGRRTFCSFRQVK